MSEESFLNSTTFWYSVAAFLFATMIIIKARKPLLGWLDSEIAQVRAELDEAKKLHAEAVATLQDYRARQQDAAKEAEAIVREAKNDAARLRDEATVELKEALARHEQLFLDRVRLAQEDAVDEVRAFVIEEMLVEARGKLSKLASGPEATDLLNRIIEDLPKLQKKKTA